MVEIEGDEPAKQIFTPREINEQPNGLLPAEQQPVESKQASAAIPSRLGSTEVRTEITDESGRLTGSVIAAGAAVSISEWRQRVQAVLKSGPARSLSKACRLLRRNTG